MKILFVHQNFPGQFLHLAPALAARGHDCRALTDFKNDRKSQIPVLRYKHNTPPPDPAATRLGRNFTQMSDRGVSAARACLQLRDKHGYVPDVIVGHSGWGETLFLKEIWPEAKLIAYAEFYYRGVGRDVGFDPEFSRSGFDAVMMAQSRAAHLGQSLLHADAALAPTKWQASAYPPALQPMIRVIFDGVNTDVMAPNSQASLTLPDGHTLRAGDEVLTFVNRNLEPYRGYHSFMRALPDVMAARPKAQVVLVGGDDVSYGAAAPKGQTWKQIFLDEVADHLDMARVHFLGKVPYPDFVSLMQISRVHAYLTYPFVLSWSMLEAMSAGAYVVGSRSAPVEELIEDGVNGRLVDFFDIKAWSAALIEGLAEPERFMPQRQAARQTILDGYDLHGICLPRMIDFVESFAPKPA
ncbi:glycosyltransferase [Pseudorhodobacter turbinis]|uniref:Glycosyltransferase n=1 Tax=Pseudorhodobacter turbinis TaxID=2500533 RepID=A0A4P8EGF6_9RHOB|nr:glycosyltransferase [Pseudorhodobacter turbinis]QCO56241.1 glycosyltransferase [Pseudorhodobacter turbinis]